MGNTYQGVRVRRKPYPEAVVELARGFEMRSAPFVEIRVRAQVLGHVPPHDRAGAHSARPARKRHDSRALRAVAFRD
jgi:hypothetical protein